MVVLKNSFEFFLYLLFIILGIGSGERVCSNVEFGCKVVKTKLGQIGGVQLSTIWGGNSFCGYRGIPFAQSPTGDLRFKAPVATGPWEGTLNASDYGSVCIQTSDGGSKSPQSEDCLFLNVFVPSASVCNCNTTNIPIIVYIFGGAFTRGGSNKRGPELILNRCVIFVSMNYRVGVFGFLPLALPEYSGNMGLKDQQLAMQWVKEHISAFGGDPNRILLSGQSAGAASVGFHILNKKSRKLFNRAYAMSGSAISLNAQMETNDLRPQLRTAAQTLGINVTTDEQLIEAIKTIPTSVWLQLTYINGTSIDRFPTWSAAIENIDARKPFLTKDPLDIYHSMSSKCDDIPSTIYTYVSMEMIPYIKAGIDDPTLIEDLNRNFYFRLPFHNFDQVKCKEAAKPILAQMRQFYFGNNTINASTIMQYVRMLSYYTYIYPIQRDVNIRAKRAKCPQRLQINNQKTPLNIFGASDPHIAALPGPGHTEDLCHLLYCKSSASLYAAVDKYKSTNMAYMNAYKTSEEMIDILVSYASTGNPVSRTGSLTNFPRISRHPLRNLSYVVIMDTGDIAVGANPTNEEYNLWRHIDLRVQKLIRMGCSKVNVPDNLFKV
ncbi:carboxylic ester hydrolase-like [Sitodiplosis mosellana]|uniref:carboxylic ester hydrolase-like n=1 Tax=Sitodiplosis mosellana TaxID=263140 RepID=UPI0024446626|nr:carboxylic ester hydrolase-like [Sitodiplosis mosellana]